MKIIHKILLQFIFLIVVVSCAIIFTTIKLSDESREEVFNGVSDKLLELREIYRSELEMAKIVANNGIVDASGLVAIDQVTTLTINNQQDFYNVVSEKIDQVGTDIVKKMTKERVAIDESLDQILSKASDSIGTIMEFDSNSFQVIANAALFNVSYLQSAALEGLKRIESNQKKHFLQLADLADDNNFDIDKLLIVTIEDNEHPDSTNFREMDKIVTHFDHLKRSIEDRERKFFEKVVFSVDQQNEIVAEEIRLAVENIKWIINQEQKNSAAVQAVQIADTIEKLLLLQEKTRTRIGKSTKLVRETINHFKNELPAELQKKGEKSNVIIEARINKAKNDIVRTQTLVNQGIEENTRKAQKFFKTTIDESKQVIDNSMQSSLHRTTKLNLLIAVICVLLAVVFGFMMIRLITNPISHVLEFADKISNGDLSGRLEEGSDEMGEMARALNQMANELEKLQTATINSFNETLDQVMDCVFMFDPKTKKFIYANQGALDYLEYTREELYSLCPTDITPEFTKESFQEKITPLKDGQDSLTFLTLHKSKTGKEIPVEVLLKYAVPPGNDPRFVAIVRNITERIAQKKERNKIQAELLHKQKLESVGQLAAGIAHEINTPIQFVGTNIEFFSETYEEIEQFIIGIQTASKKWPDAIQDQMTVALENLDWEYLAEEIPTAIQQSKDGVERVSLLVGAMKRFSHPGSKELVETDLNSIIETALTVSSNEWKYNAEIVKSYDNNLPKVPLLVDQMGQVFLNMIVNASQAIHEKNVKNGTDEKGVITISTQVIDEKVILTFHDTGIGIPESIIAKIFDPFFTTKEVGKGTGQGLAICHDVITKKHNGSLRVFSPKGEGTTFVIEFPLKSKIETKKTGVST